MDINAAGNKTINVRESAICIGRLNVALAPPFTPIAESGETEAGPAKAFTPAIAQKKIARNIMFSVPVPLLERSCFAQIRAGCSRWAKARSIRSDLPGAPGARNGAASAAGGRGPLVEAGRLDAPVV